MPWLGDESTLGAEEATDCWFDEPDPADRRSWAIPPGHGTYQGLDLELLDPDDENELSFLIEAQHPELKDALRKDEEIVVDGGLSAQGCPANGRHRRHSGCCHGQ